MKENSIKEDIEILEKNIKSVKENADMAFFESDEDYCFFKAVEHILSDYKRVLKENEELKFEERSRIIGKYEDAEIHDVINRTLSNDYIPVKKVKNKIEFLDNQQKQWLEDRELKASDSEIIFARDFLQELLEGRK